MLRQITTLRMARALALAPAPAVAAAGAVLVVFCADLSAIRAFDIGRGEVFFLGYFARAAHATVGAANVTREPGLVQTMGVRAGGIVILAAFGAQALAETH